ncbi:DUF4142 domain-containing protein [Hymenobacter sp. BT175]|uniref:DUF4142 domain-containing protein n=1 Tax=Hymenobacter translucens TaxID=2886507 RepID=UPI001D0DD9E5|nr:DUF4142 domain-containing protein [Hymenobacter translucens]MCC2545904.1 DUF4142 domain-containing protein [Hymenobacter translucens]
MKRTTLSLLSAVLLLASACSTNDDSATTTTTTTDSEVAGGNAGDNYMNGATTGDSATTTMPADASAAGSAAATGTAPADQNANSSGSTMPHSTDPEFMKSAAHSDQNEIQLSKLVLSKGATGMAKDHANMMIKDHTKSTTDLMAIAKKKGVTLPTDMDAEHKAIAERMGKLTGQELERQFLTQMVTDHQKTLNTLKAHQQMTKDADLQGFIGKVTPVVSSHLDMSKKHASM